MSRVFPLGDGRSSLVGLGSPGWVGGELAGEAAVDEDVALGAGDHGQCSLSVVGRADRDRVGAGVAAPVVDGGVEHGGWCAEWLGRGSALGGLVEDVGGE